ncbi:MAG: hypothetical protein AB2392_15710 [Neobacillus sp.]
MYEKNKLKSDIEQYIAPDKVFTESDEKKVFEKISKLGNKKSRKIKSVMPKILSVIGVATLICIIAGVFFSQDLFNDPNRSATNNETNEEEKNPVYTDELEVPEESNVEDEDMKEEQLPLNSNEYDIIDSSVGEKVGEWTLLEKDASPESFEVRSFKSRFIGDQKITGTIQMHSVEESWNTYVFIPDDTSLLPSQKPSNNLPYIIYNYEGVDELKALDLKLGESVESFELRIKYVTNTFNPNKESTYPSIQLFNEDDIDYVFQSENAPDEYVDAGIRYHKHNWEDSKREFAERTDAVGYGVEGTDTGFIRKNNEIILVNTLANYIVDYEYIDTFRDILLKDWSEYDFYDNLNDDLNHFLKTGEEITNPSYRIYDLDGTLHLELIFV